VSEQLLNIIRDLAKTVKDLEARLTSIEKTVELPPLDAAQKARLIKGLREMGCSATYICEIFELSRSAVYKTFSGVHHGHVEAASKSECLHYLKARGLYEQ